MKKLFVMLLLLYCQTSFAHILIVRTDTTDFRSFRNKLAKKLSKQKIDDYIVNTETKFEDFREKVLKSQPKLLILLDNMSIDLAIKLHASGVKIPAVATMALNLKKILASQDLIAGIAFEVPGLTIVKKYRETFTNELHRIITFYRASEFSTFFQDSKKQLKREGVELIGLNVDGKSEGEVIELIEKHISPQYGGKKVDSVLLIIDNKIINQQSFPIWIKKSKDGGLPILCSIEKFTSEDIGLCAFSAHVNLAKLASQTVEIALSILEDGTDPKEIGCEYLIGTDSAVNPTRVKSLGLDRREN